MKPLFAFIFLTVLMMATSFTPAPPPAFEGEISMKTTYTYFPPELMAYKDRMPTEMKFFIKGKKVRKEGPTGFGAYQTYIYDFEKETGYVLLSFPTGKIGYKMDHNDFLEEQKLIPVPEKVEETGESKTIAGYVCNKALVTVKDFHRPLTVYYSANIPAFAYQPYAGLKGFPLWYEGTSKGVNFFVEALSVHPKTLDDSIFVFPSDYTLLTKEAFFEELKKSF